VGEAALRAAFEQIMTSCRAYDAKADIRGVLVTPMAKKGTEASSAWCAIRSSARC
jgi:hypothetical protein